MLDWPESEGDSTARITNVPWVVVEVRALPNFRLHVRFVDGTEGEVDASRLLSSSTAGVFSALRDPNRFAEAHVRDGVVRWPGDLDLAPDAMYDELKRTGPWVLEPFPVRR
jgi:hypothetical protein